MKPRSRIPIRRRAALFMCGFSLTEALVAFPISGLVMTSAMKLFTFISWVDYSLDRRNAAVGVAKTRTEFLRTLAYGDLGYSAEMDTRVNQDGVPTPGGTLFRTTTITPDPASPVSRVDVSVRISGLERRSDQVVAMSTFMMDRSLVKDMQ